MAKKTNKKFVPSKYVLPSDNRELKSFAKNFKIDMMEQVVGSIEFAINNSVEFIEVFQFKNSDFVITLAAKDYLNNLNNIYNYYMEKEVYEHCPRVIVLQKILQKKSDNTINEKQER